MQLKKFDRIIIGAGLYGLYAAELCGRNGLSVLVLECESKPFQRATYINQARVHQGYHYPRSLSTASKSAGYFKRFHEEFDFCIHREFQKIYATSKEFSWTNAGQFKNFCDAANIPCTQVYPETFFKKDQCDGAFLVREYTYDASILKDYYMDKLSQMKNVKILFDANIVDIRKSVDAYIVMLDHTDIYQTGYLLNATYASTNQINKMLGYEPFQIKYELCEIILCHVNDALRQYGFTVMDGPFFSIMPFGKTGYHSLTSVTFTPHSVSHDEVPVFDCQKRSEGHCDAMHLGNCNDCPARPASAFPYMASLARKYLKDEFVFEYSHSLFSMKPILMSSEVDDSRPTVIRTFSTNPTYVSVLSGKINTVYDLDEVLLHD